MLSLSDRFLVLEVSHPFKDLGFSFETSKMGGVVHDAAVELYKEHPDFQTERFLLFFKILSLFVVKSLLAEIVQLVNQLFYTFLSLLTLGLLRPHGCLREASRLAKSLSETLLGSEFMNALKISNFEA